MYENILASKANYERALRSARSELERKKINNERIDQFKKELAEDRTLYNEASKYVNAVKIVQTAVVKEARDYQTRRIDYLNDIITEAVGKIFPDRNVTAKLDCDFSRTDKVSLHLYDENGDSFSPRISEVNSCSILSVYLLWQQLLRVLEFIIFILMKPLALQELTI